MKAQSVKLTDVYGNMFSGTHFSSNNKSIIINVLSFLNKVRDASAVFNVDASSNDCDIRVVVAEMIGVSMRSVF